MTRMICAPTDSRSRGERDLTVAAVPTGMNTGVEICPWGVVICPVRPKPLRAPVSLNSITDRFYDKGRSDYTQVVILTVKRGLWFTGNG